ncbi:hypothetical protein Hanom_Chr16g01520451 [Helianthus anomalus]
MAGAFKNCITLCCAKKPSAICYSGASLRNKCCDVTLFFLTFHITKGVSWDFDVLLSLYMKCVLG